MLSMKDTYAAVSAGRLDTLSPFRLRKGNPIHVGLWCTRGRIRKGIQPVLGVIIMPTTRVAYLLMVEAHEVLHRGAKDTLWRCRRKAWIPNGKKLAKKVADSCLKCILTEKKLLTQRMADLLKQKFFQGKPWTNVCLDLAGPVEVRAMNNACSKLKTWLVLITCLNTGALAIHVMHQYSTSAFLIQWEYFVAVRGRPT